jgi:O-succinylbenzoate synthase
LLRSLWERAARRREGIVVVFKVQGGELSLDGLSKETLQEAQAEMRASVNDDYSTQAHAS